MTKVDPLEIKDIFGIPQDGSNIRDDEEDVIISASQNEVAAKISFEEKAKELGGEIAKAASLPVAEKSQEKPKNQKDSETPNTKKEEVKSLIKSAIPNGNNLFDDILADDESATKSEAPKVEVKKPKEDDGKGASTPVKVLDVSKPPLPVQAAKVVVEKQVETQDVGITAQLPSTPNCEPLQLKASTSGKHRWRLDSPSPKYVRFYEAKRDALENDLLHGGELEFDKLFVELEGASVDVGVGDTFVPELICKKMEECQKHRDRTKAIQMKVNRQYFMWARIIDLFTGMLKRVEYERGKQEGITYEHMYDMNTYFSELESLHKSVSAVASNLDSAFECLSRQVTVAMPMKDVERYSMGPRPLTPQLQRFDGLKMNANSSTSIGTANQKTGPSSVPEPQASGWGVVK